MYEKVSVCEKFLNRGLPLARLDEKFIFYTQIVNDLEKHKSYHDIKSIRINLQPLIKSIIDHAVEWRNTLGNILAEKTRSIMIELHEHIQVFFRVYPFYLYVTYIPSIVYEKKVFQS